MTSRPLPHKYRAVPTTIDGIRFHSKAEAKYYTELKLREKAGEIHDLVLQPGYIISVRRIGEPHGQAEWEMWTNCGKYIADFRYWDVASNQRITVDVKGYDTPLSKLKRKIVEALYGIEISSELFRREGGRWVFDGPLPASFQGYEKDHAQLLVRYMFEFTPDELRRLLATAGASGG